MNHNIKKENIFAFLKAESIVEEVSNQDSITIFENSNKNTLKLYKVEIFSLNANSKYWILNPENKTFIEPNSKKVENIILEYTQDGLLNIIMIEMKSTTCNNSEIIEKFEKSLSWVYLLLNLLGEKENQKINVYGILVSQRNKNWNTKETLNIFSSTAIRYKKKSFYTTNSSMTINFNDVIE